MRNKTRLLTLPILSKGKSCFSCVSALTACSWFLLRLFLKQWLGFKVENLGALGDWRSYFSCFASITSLLTSWGDSYDICCPKKVCGGFLHSFSPRHTPPINAVLRQVDGISAYLRAAFGLAGTALGSYSVSQPASQLKWAVEYAKGGSTALGN